MSRMLTAEPPWRILPSSDCIGRVLPSMWCACFP